MYQHYIQANENLTLPVTLIFNSMCIVTNYSTVT